VSDSLSSQTSTTARVPVTLTVEIEGDWNVAQIIQALVDGLPGTEVWSDPDYYMEIAAVEPPDA
jgi:hypothetical protein